MKIGALIPIRLASERLVKKAILDLAGKPVVYHLLDRAFASKYLEKENVVVCTTQEASDDELVEVVQQYGASVFRGDTDDIIKRFYDAMVYYKFDAVIQIDGDDITVEPYYMDLTMDKLLNDSSLDVVSVDGLPLGVSSKSFTFNAMKKVFERYKTTQNDTGFASLFTETDFCNSIVLKPVSTEHIDDSLRLTLDYQQDLDFFEVIFKELYKEGEVFHIEDIIQLIKRKPELNQINSNLQEEYMKRWYDKRNIYYIDNEGKMKKI
ncbi:cytidylyltransferase domain-containing protein [Bacteroidota bacterium]